MDRLLVAAIRRELIQLPEGAITAIGLKLEAPSGLPAIPTSWPYARTLSSRLPERVLFVSKFIRC